MTTAVALICSCSSSSVPVAGADGGDATTEASVLGATDASDEDSGTVCALPGKYGSTECEACVATRCCDEIAACEAVPECQALRKCALDCLLEADAGGCYADCRAAHPSGLAQWDPEDHCWFGTPPGGCLVECTN